MMSASPGMLVMGESVTIGEFFIFFLVCLFTGEEQAHDKKPQPNDNDLAINTPGGDIVCDDEIGGDQCKQE